MDMKMSLPSVSSHNTRSYFLGSSLSPSPSSSLPLFFHRCNPRGRSALRVCAAEAAIEAAALLDLESYVGRWRVDIERALDAAVPMRRPESMHRAMRYSLLTEGGKRAGPILCLAACDLASATARGGAATAYMSAMAVACALEMVHTASLIHDDLPCMDDDDVRRGQPAAHRVFGSDLAMLAGDALYALAMEHATVASAAVPPENILRVVVELGKAVGSEGMVAGQFLELSFQGNPDLDVKTLQEIYIRKTALLAECSTVCGAIIGGASEDEIEKLRKYGRNLGLLFQIVDDYELLKLPNGRRKSSEKKTTFVKLIGFKETKDFVEELKHEAAMCLSSFDREKAAPLLCFLEVTANKLK